MQRPAITVTVFFLLAISLATPVCVADAPPANPYSGDIWSRSTLTGDWGGFRNYLAKKGVTTAIVRDILAHLELLRHGAEELGSFGVASFNEQIPELHPAECSPGAAS